MTAERKSTKGVAAGSVRFQFQTPSSLGEEIAAAPYLTLSLGDSRQTFPLPWTGEVLIGRAESCHVIVNNKSVSRVNTRITTIRGEAAVTDLKSRNGTRVNGKRIEDTQALVSGDMIGVCNAELTFHEAGKGEKERPILDFARFKQRTEEELERLLLYQRPLALLVAQLEATEVDRLLLARALSGLLRVIDLAAWHEGQVMVLLTETDAERVPFALDRIERSLAGVAPVSRVGFATSPTDGFNFDALLARALVDRPGERAPESGPVLVGKSPIVASDPTMRQLFALIERLARADLAVLISGETGTGKEVVAQALHEWSPRRDKRFVTLNCAAFQENLLESELFGHERGAFSGAAGTKPGLLEMANGGTVLLDEIGELSATAQAKLLRVLETKRLTRLGGVQEREVDIRIVAATNRALHEEVKIGHFRQDLYFRLSAAIVEIPPLRERKREIPKLAQLFLDRACDAGARTRMRLDAGALERLLESTWPGNVRQLRNAMEYVAATVPGEVVERGHLRSGPSETFEERLYDDETTEYALGGSGARAIVERKPDLRQRFPVLQDEIAALTARRIVQALEATGGNQTQAARLIGMPLRTFISKLKELKPGGEDEGGASE
jgi:two-component system, NtrC family, response regulator AtoC